MNDSFKIIVQRKDFSAYVSQLWVKLHEYRNILFYRFWIRLLLDIYMDIIITTKFLVVVVSIIIIFALKVRESLLRCRKKRFSSIGWRWRFGIFDVSSSSWKRFVSSYVLKFLLSNNFSFQQYTFIFYQYVHPDEKIFNG